MHYLVFRFIPLSNLCRGHPWRVWLAKQGMLTPQALAPGLHRSTKDKCGALVPSVRLSTSLRQEKLLDFDDDVSF